MSFTDRFLREFSRTQLKLVLQYKWEKDFLEEKVMDDATKTAAAAAIGIDQDSRFDNAHSTDAFVAFKTLFCVHLNFNILLAAVDSMKPWSLLYADHLSLCRCGHSASNPLLVKR